MATTRAFTGSKVAARTSGQKRVAPVLPSRRRLVCKAQQRLKPAALLTAASQPVLSANTPAAAAAHAFPHTDSVQTQAVDLAKRAAAGAAALTLSLGALSVPAIASEFDVLGETTPTSYFYDDASVLSKSTKSDLNKRLSFLETTSGYRVEVVTVRKLEFETDAFAFADKVVENWYPGAAKDNKGVLLVVTAGKEGAVSGGDKFLSAVGDDLIDSIVSDNIPIFTEEERYNQTVLSCVERLEAQLTGQPVPEAPQRADNTRKRNYKTKEETEKSKTVTSTVVLTLLLIACIVPMLQYYGYTARD